MSRLPYSTTITLIDPMAMALVSHGGRSLSSGKRSPTDGVDTYVPAAWQIDH